MTDPASPEAVCLQAYDDGFNTPIVLNTTQVEQLRTLLSTQARARCCSLAIERGPRGDVLLRITDHRPVEIYRLSPREPERITKLEP